MNSLITTISFRLNSQKENKPFLGDVSFLKNGKRKPVIIFVHGFKGFKDWGPFNKMANYFAEQNFVFVKFNFSHNGTTPESPSEFLDPEAFGKDNHSTQLNDLEEVLDWVTKNGAEELKNEIDPERIYLIGHSRGGSVAILKGAEDARVKRIVTWAAVSDLLGGYSFEDLHNWKRDGVRWVVNTRTQQRMPVYYQYIEDLQVNNLRLNVLNAAALIHQPLLLIHGEEDEAVPLFHATEIHKKAKHSIVIIIPKTNHTFGGRHPYTSGNLPVSLKQLYNTSIDFLKKEKIRVDEGFVTTF
ncbi:MAG TPA: alpha/beta fold hydrolase [Bacteroidia bacterium]|jgi:dienelactone hydrolase|nr:alpha/beta fold hydrolase [Bacteroidia bacterium]